MAGMMELESTFSSVTGWRLDHFALIPELVHDGSIAANIVSRTP